MLGYLLMLAVRVWGTSFNPIFTDFTYNNIATGTGVFLVVYLYLVNWRTPIIYPESSEPSKQQQPASTTLPGLAATGVGFGALFFLSMLLFGEVSVLSRWAVAPYPDRGPYPYPWG